MSLQFILGRAGSGKSEYCLEAIRKELREQPDGEPIVLLVPEQASFLAEYALVTTPGLSGSVRAQVLSFRRLAHRILQEAGGIDRQPIDDTGKKMLLYRIMEQRRSELKLFKEAGIQSGYIEAFLELIQEMKRYECTPGQLAAMSGEGLMLGMARRTAALKDKLHDLSLIYHDYELELSLAYFDAEDMFPLAAEKMIDSEIVGRTRFYVDGFHGFTPQELKLIGSLLQRSAGLKLTLSLDRVYSAGEKPEELDLYHPTAVTMGRLQELAEELGVPVEPAVLIGEPKHARFAERPMLAHLEQRFARPSVYAGADDGGVRIVAAMNRRAEVEGVAREMLRLARDEQVRWRDMAVMVRNLEGYIDLVEAVFTDYEIPSFLDQKRAVTHHPLIEFVRAALEVIKDRWRYDAVFRCVKTDFFLDLDAEERGGMDELENYVLALGIHGSRWTQKERWDYRVTRSLELDEQEASRAEQLTLDRIHRNRMRVATPLMTFERKVKAGTGVKAMVEALYGLLEDVQAAERLEHWSDLEIAAGRPEKAREHVQVWSSLIDVLDQIVEVLGDKPVQLEPFIGMLNAGLEGLRLGLVPPALDQVLIGSPDRTRSAHIRYCFVLGVNDGVYPAKMKEGGIITEQEREQLADAGLELAPGSRRRLLDDQFLIYSAFATPSRVLWLSYPLADEEGKALQPSELIRRMKRMFPAVREQFLHLEPHAGMDETEQASFAVRPQLALTLVLTQLRNWSKGIEISPVWWDAYNWLVEDEEYRRSLGQRLYGLFYTNEERPLGPDMSRLLYGPQLRASVSRMEKFAACPFSHFASYGLRLRERQVYRLEAPDVGQLFHAALSMLAVELQEEKLGWGDLEASECERRASMIVDRLAPALQSRILLSSRRHAYIARKLKSIVSRASAVLGEHARRGDFVPVGLEVAFGAEAELPPLQFALDNGFTMEIVGRIDRVDKAETDRGLLVRVIDYKSSQTALKLGDVYYGLSLQMLTYLDVVLTHAEHWLGRKAEPAGVLYFHVHQPLLQTKNAIPPEVAEAERFKRYQMKGLVTADPEIVQAMDHRLGSGQSRSDIVPVALKNDGGFYKYSSVVTPDQWGHLRDYVRTAIRRIGTEITEGQVDITPYRAGPRSACQFCPYKPVCQFDPEQEGNQYHLLRSGSNDDWWARMQTAAGLEGGEVDGE